MKYAKQSVVSSARGVGHAITCRALGVGLAVLAAGTCAWPGCASKDPVRPPSQQIRDTDRMVTVEDGDPRLVAATEEARRRWPEFEKAFRDRGTSRRCFVKVRVDAEPRGYEYLWVEADMVSGNTIWGRVNSTPKHTTLVREGEPLTIYLPEVWDWAVSQGERIVAGGFQAKVLERGTP